jgi:hypothetical protein
MRLEHIKVQLHPQPPAVMSFVGLEPDEEDLETLRAEEALGKILRELKEKRDTVELWKGTHRLLAQLPELSDDAPVSGDDAYRVFEDLLGALPEEDPDTEDPDFLTVLGLPEDVVNDAYRWDGWTAGMVRKGQAELAYSVGREPEKLLAKALKKRLDIQEQNADAVQRLEAIVKVLPRRMKTKEDRLKRERMLPERRTPCKRSAVTRRTWPGNSCRPSTSCNAFKRLVADRPCHCQRPSMWWSPERLERT